MQFLPSVLQIYLTYLAVVMAFAAIGFMFAALLRRGHTATAPAADELQSKRKVSTAPEHSDEAEADNPVSDEITQLLDGMALLKRRMDLRRKSLTTGSENDPSIVEMKKLYHRMRARNDRLRKRAASAVSSRKP